MFSLSMLYNRCPGAWPGGLLPAPGAGRSAAAHHAHSAEGRAHHSARVCMEGQGTWRVAEVREGGMKVAGKGKEGKLGGKGGQGTRWLTEVRGESGRTGGGKDGEGRRGEWSDMAHDRLLR